MENHKKPGGLAKFQVTAREECGVIVTRIDDGILYRYVLKVPNHAEHEEDYEIHAEDVAAVQRVLSESEEITGFMHTHLGQHKCEPTESDYAGAALFPEMENLIYQPTTHEHAWYTAR